MNTLDAGATARSQAAAKYKPSKARVLFVAEAPPAEADRYFYFEHVWEGDWLWCGLMKALYPNQFGETRAERLRKGYWLERFRADGYQLIDAVKHPISGDDAQRIAAIESRQASLISEILDISPDQLVLIKSSVFDALCQPFRSAGLNVANEIFLPFPSTGNQTKFQTEFNRLIESGKLILRSWVAGVDACKAGWVELRIDLRTRTSSVAVIDLVSLLRQRPPDLECVAIDIPIGLLDGPRACDIAARQLLGWPRRNSVFSPPCRAALSATSHAQASDTNLRIAGRGLSQQAWGITPKIKQVDDVITPTCQLWAFEVHPEISFWALAGKHPMTHRKKSLAGLNERLAHIRPVFQQIDYHLDHRPSGVAKDDLLDAAVAAWTAIRISTGCAQEVSEQEEDSNGLLARILY